MNRIDHKGFSLEVDQILEKLGPFLTEARKEKIEKVLAGRTRSFVPVLEELYDRGNISAVLRSAEAHGLMEVHVVNSGGKFKESQRVTQGADKWLDLNNYKNIEESLSELKERGYQIYCTHLSQDAITMDQVDFSKKTALIFGNEKEGVSETALKLADGNALLPMKGFTQSYNISVAAALSFQEASRGCGHGLSEEDEKKVRARYYLASLNWPIEALKQHLDAF